MAMTLAAPPGFVHPAKKNPSTSASASPLVPLSPAVIACLCYITCSTALTLANKHVFSSTEELNSPWTLLCTQSLAVSLILSLYLLLSGRTLLNFTLARQMMLPCLLFTAYIFSNSQALRTVSLPILSVLKSLAPMGIALAERVAFKDRITPGTAAAMLLIVVGNTVTVFNDMEFSRDGYSWAIINVIVNIAYVLSLRVYLSDEFTPIEKALHSNLIASCIMLPLAFASGEVTSFVDTFATTSFSFRAVFLLSCLLSAGIGASIFWVVQTTSGSTLSFAGACNKFVVVILGGMLFQANITPVGWVSVFFGVLAGVVFAVAKANVREKVGDTEKENVVSVHTTVIDVDGYESDDGEETFAKSLLRPS